MKNVKIGRKDPAYRILISKIYHFIVGSLFGVPFRDMDCGYRIIKKELAQTIAPQCHLLPYSYWFEFTVRSVKRGIVYRLFLLVTEKGWQVTRVMYPIKKIPLMTIRQMKGLLSLYTELDKSGRDQ